MLSGLIAISYSREKGPVLCITAKHTPLGNREAPLLRLEAGEQLPRALAISSDQTRCPRFGDMALLPSHFLQFTQHSGKAKNYREVLPDSLLNHFSASGSIRRRSFASSSAVVVAMAGNRHKFPERSHMLYCSGPSTLLGSATFQDTTAPNHTSLNGTGSFKVGNFLGIPASTLAKRQLIRLANHAIRTVQGRGQLVLLFSIMDAEQGAMFLLNTLWCTVGLC